MLNERILETRNSTPEPIGYEAHGEKGQSTMPRPGSIIIASAHARLGGGGIEPKVYAEIFYINHAFIRVPGTVKREFDKATIFDPHAAGIELDPHPERPLIIDTKVDALGDTGVSAVEHVRDLQQKLEEHRAWVLTFAPPPEPQ